MRLVLFALLISFAAAFGSMSRVQSMLNIKKSPMKMDLNTKIRERIQMQSSSGETKVLVSANRKGGDATVAASTFNLAKCIIGAGVLSLPSGVAFFSDEPVALIPAAGITILMGLMAAYTFNLIGKACEATNAKSFQEAWNKSVDPKSGWLISSGITATCFLACIAYSIIIGDSFSALAKTFNLPTVIAGRTNIILAITAAVLTPLCSMKSLSALAPFSLLGLGGTLYTAVFMAIRFFDKSYAPGGKYFATLAAASRPVFSKRGGMSLNASIFVLISMLSSSFIAHFNAPAFYNDLENTSLSKFSKVVNTAFIVSIISFIFITGTGFLTFGGATSGYVLNNYASGDLLATFARLAIGIAIVTGYPLTFAALRDGILDLVKVTGDNRKKLFYPATYGLIGLITSLALVLKDVGFVLSVCGALFGSALMFMVPAIMNISNMKRQAKQSKVSLTSAENLEIGFNYGLIGTGAIMGVLGVAISVLRELGKF